MQAEAGVEAKVSELKAKESKKQVLAVELELERLQLEMEGSFYSRRCRVSLESGERVVEAG